MCSANTFVKLLLVIGLSSVLGSVLDTVGPGGTPTEYYTDNNETIDVGRVSGIYLGKPSAPTRLNTTYYVYDQESRDSPRYAIRWNDSFVTRPSLFNPTDNITVILHGFGQNYTYDWLQELKDVLIDQGDANTKVLLVDWAIGAVDGATEASLGPYLEASNNVLMEARTLAAALQRMMAAYEIPETSIHIVGQSLGAQLMGLTAKRLVKRFQIKIGRGTATDAASPVIGWAGNRPNKSHAHFMEAIHTAAASNALGTAAGSVGIYEPYAHVDLYPNKGVIIQPACRGNNTFFCSHNQAPVFYIDMVKRCDERHDFYGTICSDVRAATSGRCSGDTVRVCNFIETERNKATHGEKSTIIYFATIGDRLNMTTTN